MNHSPIEYLYAQEHFKRKNNINNLNNLNNGSQKESSQREKVTLTGNGSGKQLLFTSVKNKKEKKHQVNFQIIKPENANLNGNNCSNKETSTTVSNPSQINNNQNMLLSHQIDHLPTNDNIYSNFNNEKNEAKNKISKFKEDYIELLIVAAEEILSKGLTTMENINNILFNNNNSNISNISSMTNNNYKIDNDCDSHSSNGNSDLRKCDNKACSVIAHKKANWVKVKNSCLCVGCHKAWKNGQFCFYCNFIFRDNSSNYNDTKPWVQCDFCESWQHMHCEESKGAYNDIVKLTQDPFFKYCCPLCRNKKENTAPVSTKRKYIYKKNLKKDTFIGNKTKSSNLELDFVTQRI